MEIRILGLIHAEACEVFGGEDHAFRDNGNDHNLLQTAHPVESDMVYFIAQLAHPDR